MDPHYLYADPDPGIFSYADPDKLGSGSSSLILILKTSGFNGKIRSRPVCVSAPAPGLKEG